MRLLDIVFYLLKSNSKVTIKNIARQFEVSTKTIQRDLDKLSILGIPIIIHRGKNGGVEIDKNYAIVKYMLKYDDYESLMLSLYISESISKDISDSFLIDRFKMVDSERACKILNKLKERFIVDIYEEKFHIKSKVCKEIDKALDSKYFIDIKAHNGIFIVFPISYVLRKEGLCLYCCDKEYKLILISDIYSVDIVNKKYEGNIISYSDNKENFKLI